MHHLLTLYVCLCCEYQVKFQAQFAQQHLDAADPKTLQAIEDYRKQGYLERDDLVLPEGVEDTEDTRRAYRMMG